MTGMHKVKINSYQFLVLVVLFSIGSSILVIPSVLASEAKQDAWIVTILGTGLGLVVIWFYCVIAQWFPQLTFIQLTEKILGTWLGKAVSLLLVFMSFIYSASLLSYSGTFLNTHLMPSTPLVALNILVASVIVMGVRLGLETIARSAEILILFFFILFFLLVLFISPEIKFENVQPVFEAGPKKIIQSTLPFIEVTSMNAIVLLMIFPALINEGVKSKKFFILGNLIAGISVTILTFLCIAVLGAYMSAHDFFPGYALAKRINFGNFIQRIEGFMAGLWIIALYYKATLYFYTSVIGFAQIVNLKDYRPLTVPMGVLAVALSLIIFPNVIYQKQWNASTGMSLSITVGIFIPLLLAIVYAIRRKKLK